MKVCDEKIKVTSICLKEATRWLGAVSAMYTLPVKKELERPASILRVRAKKVLKSTKGEPGHEQEGHSVAAADFEGCRHDNDQPGEETRETGGKKHLSWTKQLLEEAAKEGKNHWRNILKCS